MIYYDSSDLEGLDKWYKTGIISGATTNPVILLKEGVLDIPEHIQSMIDVTSKHFPISIELPDSDMPTSEMFSLAQKYHNMFPDNAVIKVPMDCRKSPVGFYLIKELVNRHIAVNATLGLTSGQLIGAMEAGADYVSLFWGRCQEAGGIGVERTLKTFLKYREVNDLDSKIIIGSIRSTDQIDRAFELGADIVTIPPKLLEEWMYTERGVETADQFNKAYRDVKEKVRLI